MYESFLSSEQTVTEWCAENGVTRKTFYYRLRQIRNEAIDQIEQHDITDIDFADDRTDDTDDTRFKKHNRYLRSLKEDTLIVIDNFNTTD